MVASPPPVSTMQNTVLALFLGLIGGVAGALGVNLLLPPGDGAGAGGAAAREDGDLEARIRRLEDQAAREAVNVDRLTTSGHAAGAVRSSVRQYIPGFGVCMQMRIIRKNFDFLRARRLPLCSRSASSITMRRSFDVIILECWAPDLFRVS